MVIEHMNQEKTQIGSLSALEHMIALGDLSGNLKAFLLSCKVEELSPVTVKDYEQKIGTFVKFCSDIGMAAPSEVTVNQVRLFLLNLQQRCNPHSVHDYYGCVKRFFNWLVSEGVLKANPMASMRSPRVPRRIIRPFSADHIKDMLLLCNESKFLGVRNRAIILTLLDTGLRLSEVANIQLRDVDFDQETIKVMGKGARERVVGIGKRTQKALLRYLLMRNDKYSCLWLTEERTPLQWRDVQIMIRRLGKRAGITSARPSPHTFRHTFGTQALRNKADIREVQSLLGHSTLKTTLTYVATVNSEDAIKSHRRFSPVDNLKGIQ